MMITGTQRGRREQRDRTLNTAVGEGLDGVHSMIPWSRKSWSATKHKLDRVPTSNLLDQCRRVRSRTRKNFSKLSRGEIGPHHRDPSRPPKTCGLLRWKNRESVHLHVEIVGYPHGGSASLELAKHVDDIQIPILGLSNDVIKTTQRGGNLAKELR
jgi:hypothetical protein